MGGSDAIRGVGGGILVAQDRVAGFGPAAPARADKTLHFRVSLQLGAGARISGNAGNFGVVLGRPCRQAIRKNCGLAVVAFRDNLVSHFLGPSWWCRVSGLVPKIRARGQARKREARPSPETLPPGEGWGGTAAMGKSSGQGGGATRSRRRGHGPAGRAVFYCCGGGPAVPLYLFLFAVQRRIALARTPRRGPAIVTRRAARHGPGRPWPKVRALARRDRARAIRTGSMGRDVPGESRSAGCSLERSDTPKGRGRGYDRHALHRLHPLKKSGRSCSAQRRISQAQPAQSCHCPRLPSAAVQPVKPDFHCAAEKP